MSAHESMEHAEHAEHASGSNKRIALLIAVIALFLALSETLGKGAQTESISKNVEASNLWAFFQAKSIRRTVVEATSDQAKLSLGVMGDDAAKAALQKQIENWQKTAARYRSEPETGEGSEQLAARAKHAPNNRERAKGAARHQRRFRLFRVGQIAEQPHDNEERAVKHQITSRLGVHRTKRFLDFIHAVQPPSLWEPAC